MKLIRNIVIGVILALILLYGALYLFMVIMGRSMIVSGLEKVTHRQVTMDSFGVIPPFTVQINKLDIAGLAGIDNIRITPSLSSILHRKLVLSSVKIIKPEVTLEKKRAAAAPRAPAAPAPATLTTPSGQAPAPKKDKGPAVIVNHLVIKNGKLRFVDRTAGTGGITINAEDINFGLRNTYSFPASVIMNFKLSARIPWREGAREGKVEASGWIDPVKKNMKAKVDIRDIDGIYLYPYYSQWVDLEKARIKSAKLNFTSNITGENNNVVAQNHLELTDIVRAQRPDDESQSKAEKITDYVLEAFRTLGGGKIEFNFTIRTKMDQPRFGFDLVKGAFDNEFAIARGTMGYGVGEVASVPVKVIGGVVKGISGFSKAIVQGAGAFGSKIKNSVTGPASKPAADQAAGEPRASAEPVP